ncbi:MAG: phospholipase D-like domain-containing protein [Elusimicrobia bacterium]|nr:phospholipase D-like domain-containing protein [Elusimicrobiota bacterium]
MAARLVAALAVFVLVCPAPSRAGRAGVALSPLASDRQVLEGLFTESARSVRFVFSPGLRARPRPATASRTSAAPTLSFAGVPVAAFHLGEGLDAELAVLVDACRREVDLATPVFSFPLTAEAAVRARRRGVVVRLITDYSQLAGAGGRTPELRALILAGAQVRTYFGTGPLGALRGAFAVLDGELLEAGSAPWSATGRAYDAALLRNDPVLLYGFHSYWRWLWTHAKPLSGLAEPFLETADFEEPVPSLRFKGRPWPAWAMPANDSGARRLAQALRFCRVRVDLALPRLTRALADAVLEAGRGGAVVRLVAGRDADVQLLAELAARGVLVFRLPEPESLRAQFAWLDGELLQVGSSEESGFGPALFSASADDIQGFAAEFSALTRRGR